MSNFNAISPRVTNNDSIFNKTLINHQKTSNDDDKLKVKTSKIVANEFFTGNINQPCRLQQIKNDIVKLENRSLADFIARMTDFAPADISDNVRLMQLEQKFLQDNRSAAKLQKRRHHYDSKLKDFISSQFDTPYSIREVIANAIDAYYKKSSLISTDVSSKKISVTTDKDKKKIIITDQGQGMTLKDIAAYLLIPVRSSNSIFLTGQNTAGTTGRFGQGFFSILSMLQTSNDRIIVHTKSEGHPGYRIVFKKKDGAIIFDIEEIKDDTIKGTRISIQSDYLDKQNLNHIEKNIVKKYFSYNGRSVIEMNHVRVNNSNHFKRISLGHKPEDINNGYILIDKRPSQGEGTLALTVNGILISEYKVKGKHIPKTLVIDFPSDTTLTQDRSTMNFYDLKNKAIVIQAIKTLVKHKQIPALNALFPILGEYRFDLIKTVRQNLLTEENVFFPYFEGIEDIEDIPLKAKENKTTVLLQEAYLGYKILDNIEYFYKNPYGVSIVSVKTKPDKSRIKLKTFKNGQKVIFLDEKILIVNPDASLQEKRKILEHKLALINEYISLLPETRDKKILHVDDIVDAVFPPSLDAKENTILKAIKEFDFDNISDEQADSILEPYRNTKNKEAKKIFFFLSKLFSPDHSIKEDDIYDLVSLIVKGKDHKNLSTQDKVERIQIFISNFYVRYLEVSEN